VDESKEYAEMWMRAYPAVPSLVLSSEESLQKHIVVNKEKPVGKQVLNKFGVDLPYLSKAIDSPNTK
jgi:mannose-6-phosphate isomerase